MTLEKSILAFAGSGFAGPKAEKVFDAAAFCCGAGVNWE
jgi:hypothetical protein